MVQSGGLHGNQRDERAGNAAKNQMTM